MKFCQNCGTQVSDEANFCFNCGVEIKYSDGNIHRNPVANRAVANHTWLPHYKENTIKK